MKNKEWTPFPYLHADNMSLFEYGTTALEGTRRIELPKKEHNEFQKNANKKVPHVIWLQNGL